MHGIDIIGFTPSLRFIKKLSPIRLSLFLLILVACTFSYGQSMENVRASFNNGKVTILYDLVSASEKQEYHVSLYSSHNNFSSPLERVSGDIGKTKGGRQKKAEWDARAEINGPFKGEITFRVKAEIVVMPLAFIFPSEPGSVRRGKQVSIRWEGGVPTQHVTLDLYKGTQRISSLMQGNNNGSYTWAVPSNMAKGSDYQLKLGNNTGEVRTMNLAIKAKVPLMLKILPIAAVGGIVAALGGGGGGETPPVTNNDLPAAPGPR